MAAIKQETAGGAPYHVPPEPRRWPAIGLAVGVHALLLAFLVIGVSWQNNEVAVEAEVWDVNPQVAAPPPPPPPPPQPEPEPETPPPQPAPKVAPPPPPVEQPQVKQAPPDIALEREKKRKEELKQRKLEEERLEREQRERELAEQKAEEKKAKALADKKAREDAEKKAEELAKKEEADKKKAEKEKADKLAKAKAEKAEKARLDKLHDEDLKRMMAAAGNTGSTGTAEKSAAPRRDNGYIAAITAKVKGNSSYGGDLDQPGNPTVTFHVDQLPTGEIISVRKTRSSGIAAFDDAVEKAITKSSPLPKKKDGTVERSLEINFHMKDMQ